MVGSHQYNTVMASVGFNSGRHYWEVSLDMYHSEKDIFVGVCQKQRPEQLYELHDFYGWLCTENRKVCRGDGKSHCQDGPYGDYSSIGDSIGVLLEFNKVGIATLSFYKNGQSFGIAYDNIQPGMYFPFVSLNGQGRQC